MHSVYLRSVRECCGSAFLIATKLKKKPFKEKIFCWHWLALTDTNKPWQKITKYAQRSEKNRRQTQ